MAAASSDAESLRVVVVLPRPGSYTTKSLPSERLAAYIAMSACRTSVSASGMSASPMATPMLAPTVVTTPSPSRTGTSSWARMRSTTRATPSRSIGPFSRRTNSSPPRRAAVSAGRRQPRRRSATVRSSTSPASWPKVSLTGLKPSRSRYRTAGQMRVRPAVSTACRTRSRNRVRLGSPVSGSCSAWCRSCSLRSVTCRRFSSSRPRSREVATWRAKVSSSARSLELNVVTSPSRPPTSSSPCTRSSVRSAAAIASFRPRLAA